MAFQKSSRILSTNSWPGCHPVAIQIIASNASGTCEKHNRFSWPNLEGSQRAKPSILSHVLTSPIKFQLRWNSGACGFRGEYVRPAGPEAFGALTRAAPAAPGTRAAPATPVPAPAAVFGGIDQETRILLQISRRQLDAAHTLK